MQPLWYKGSVWVCISWHCIPTIARPLFQPASFLHNLLASFFTADYANDILPFLNIHTPETNKPDWTHEMYMMSQKMWCTKGSLWLATNMANIPDCGVGGHWDENESSPEKTASEQAWLPGIAACQLKHNHNNIVDSPDRLNMLCQLKYMRQPLHSNPLMVWGSIP